MLFLWPINQWLIGQLDWFYWTVKNVLAQQNLCVWMLVTGSPLNLLVSKVYWFCYLCLCLEVCVDKRRKRKLVYLSKLLIGHNYPSICNITSETKVQKAGKRFFCASSNSEWPWIFIQFLFFKVTDVKFDFLHILHDLTHISLSN